MSLKQITFVRHGKADNSLEDHRLHPLSETGRRQAEKRRVSLGEPTFDLVLHSELRRTGETARIVAGIDEGAETRALAEFFYSKKDRRGDVLNAAFEALGHATLREYRELAEAELKSLSLDASKAVQEAVENAHATNVLIVGHGVLLQGLCAAICGEYNTPFTDRVLGECEGFRIGVRDGCITYIESF